ncbi:MAG: glycogen/starch synthase [Prevotella sp.]|nr:glycogen/starch synthase [Prevotella sp.]
MGKKVLFINQEITPYVSESEMSLMGSLMPHKMQEAGFEIRTFMPKWGTINERRGQLHEVIRLSGMNLIIDDTDHPLIIKVASIPQSRIQVYFIDNEDYFQKRKTTVDELGDEYPDNGERAIFFARGVLETVKKLRWTPDIIHCQGWMSAVVPFYVKTAYHDEPQFANAKVVTSLFSEQPKGDFGTKFKQSLEFRDAKSSLIEKYGEKFDFIEMGKLAIDYSDAIVKTSSKVNTDLINYAKDNNKAILKHPANDDLVLDAYKDFYNKFIEE